MTKGGNKHVFAPSSGRMFLLLGSGPPLIIEKKKRLNHKIATLSY
jgi:hypothetical protein